MKNPYRDMGIEKQSCIFSSSAYARIHNPIIKHIIQYVMAGIAMVSVYHIIQYGDRAMDKAF